VLRVTKRNAREKSVSRRVGSGSVDSCGSAAGEKPNLAGQQERTRTLPSLRSSGRCRAMMENTVGGVCGFQSSVPTRIGMKTFAMN
jgi:hypothetical protein